jgi:hypothetical protein
MSAKSAHPSIFRQSGIRFAARKCWEIELGVVPQDRCPLLRNARYRMNEHSRSPRLGGWGAPPMEILP